QGVGPAALAVVDDDLLDLDAAGFDDLGSHEQSTAVVAAVAGKQRAGADRSRVGTGLCGTGLCGPGLCGPGFCGPGLCGSAGRLRLDRIGRVGLRCARRSRLAPRVLATVTCGERERAGSDSDEALHRPTVGGASNACKGLASARLLGQVPHVMGSPQAWTDLEDPEQVEAIMREGGPAAVIDFWSETCGPCKMMAPAFEHVAGQFDPA